MSDTARVCPSCGAESAGTRFCLRCGFALPLQPITAPTLPPLSGGSPDADPPRRDSLPLAPSTKPDPGARHAREQRPEFFAPTLASGDLEAAAAVAAAISAGAAASAARLADSDRRTRIAPDSASPISEGQILGAVPAEATASLLGVTLAGRYRVDSLIGEGGFGAVYGGTHLALGERVAIKLLHAEWAVQPEFRARFRREAVALSRLRHPGIVTVLDFGEESGRPFLVMEMVRGRSLARVISDGPDALGAARLGNLFAQILEVLEVAHAAGIVHRDMKPDNVLLVPEPALGGGGGGGGGAEGAAGHERVKVLDFGIALVDDQDGGGRLTSTGAVQGTPLYMSPEQCRGRDVGPPTDIYAVGAMLYETLAGVPPFSGDTSTDLMVKHMFMVPPPVVERGWKREPPPELEALAHWALSKRPEERPARASCERCCCGWRRARGRWSAARAPPRGGWRIWDARARSGRCRRRRTRRWRRCRGRATSRSSPGRGTR